MRYQLFAKKIDGTEEKWGNPASLSSCLHQIKMLTWMQNRKSNKNHDYLYWYCLPVTKEETEHDTQR